MKSNPLPDSCATPQPILGFQFRAVADLPRLAWCARLSRRTSTILVEHGPWIETHELFFIEGAWDGIFEAGKLGEATVVLGSGGCVESGEAVFCTTSHTMERLQSVTVGDDFFISNSFAYLLTATGDSLDVNYRFYERDFMTFLKGRGKATRTIQTARKREIKLYYGEKIRVDSGLNVQTEPFPDTSAFDTYESYIAVVDDLIVKLHRNATAQRRHMRYEPLSTISSGYDSPACTVFAKKTGCKQAITFLEARTARNAFSRPPKDPYDSGEQIAKYLEVDVETFRRDAWLAREDFPEAEFLATGSGGDDTVVASAEQRLAGTILFTGFLGDTLWGLDATADELAESTDYVYKFPAGGALGEFRIRVGFVHLPVPLLTFTRHADMHRISRSAELAPWRIGNGAYDRPVPRRLVETSGVPRAIYAQEKKAITEPFWLAYDAGTMQEMMSPHSHQDLAAYATSAAVLRRLSMLSRIKMRWGLLTAPIAPALNWYNFKLEKKLGIRLFPRLRTGQFRTSVLFSTLAGLKFHWAIEKTTSRYIATRYGRDDVATVRHFHTSMRGKPARGNRSSAL